MAYRSDVIYSYDGSFEGLLCCVFESYNQKEVPAEIVAPGEHNAVLFPVKEVATDEQRAKRVLASIPEKMGKDALDFVQRAFLTCLPQKELHILRFLRLGYEKGPAVLDMLTNSTVDALHKAVKHLERESHLLTGFVRFSIANNALTAVIEPKNCVLPLLARHFCERYREESFLIYDKTHGMALIYQPYRHMIMPIDDLELPEPDAEEIAFRELWRLFYDTIGVEGRFNPKLRQNLMPKRYWKYLTEFGGGEGPRGIGTKGQSLRLNPPHKVTDPTMANLTLVDVRGENMAKPRKMLSDWQAPHIQSLMRLIETQSKDTIANWCIDYAETHLLPLWEQSFPEDARPKAALNAARNYLAGKIKLPEAKQKIYECRNAAREAEGSLIPQGAARTVDAATSAIHNPASSLGLALYGALTIAYSQVGIDAPWELLQQLAAAECAKMESALRAVAVENEPKPAKINWNC